MKLLFFRYIVRLGARTLGHELGKRGVLETSRILPTRSRWWSVEVLSDRRLPPSLLCCFARCGMGSGWSVVERCTDANLE